VDKRKLSTIVVLLFGAAVLVLLFRFNRLPQSYERYLVGNMAGLLWVPMLTVFFILREQADGYGFRPAADRGVWIWVLALVLLALAGESIVARWPRYQGYYPMYRQFGLGSPNATDIRLLLYFELTYGMYLFCWEFFFRGYMLFGMARTLGWAAIIVQAIPFGVMHYGKPEFLFSFIGGIVLGILAYRSRSFLPAFVLHWAASVGLDLLVLAHR